MRLVAYFEALPSSLHKTDLTKRQTPLIYWFTCQKLNTFLAVVLLTFVHLPVIQALSLKDFRNTPLYS